MKNLNLEKATVQPEMIGNVYRIDGKAYVLSQDELVYDAETQEVIFDSAIYDRVFDRYEEDLRIVSAIRRKAKELAHGDSAMEEALRLHFAFTGLPHDSEEPEIKAA